MAGWRNIRLSTSAGLRLQPDAFIHALRLIGHKKIPVFVDPTQVSGAEEPLATDSDKCPGRVCRALPVTLEYLRPGNQDLAGLSDRHRLAAVRVDHQGFRLTYGMPRHCCLVASGGIEVRWRCGFWNQPVAFRVAQAELLEQALRHRLRHRRTATADIDQ